MKILITGGAGFIGSNLVRKTLSEGHEVVNFDSLTYATKLNNLSDLEGHKLYHFVRADLRDKKSIQDVFKKYLPDAVMHLAAESHVDRSIEGPKTFIDTNIYGTFNLLECSKDYWMEVGKEKDFKFLHVSTDEVFGSLGEEGKFTEESPYSPNSPYSASKAASDHLVRAWNKTYKLPVLITNCSNNYGPYQYPEKFIPLIILSALVNDPIPVYGNGANVRDWLFVEDHVIALMRVLQKGKIGSFYNVGGKTEIKNIDLVNLVCELLQEKIPSSINYKELITFVDDRPGHDFRYSIDSTKIEEELNWAPLTGFRDGLSKTIDWYISNKDWLVKTTN